MEFNLEKKYSTAEPTYSEADFNGYHSAPLLTIGEKNKRRALRQDRIAHQFAELAHYELGDSVHPSVVQYVGESIQTRMHQREALNGSQYRQRLNRYPDIVNIPEVSPLMVLWACDRALRGKASVQQNEIARRAFGLGAVEYASLTTIGSLRRELHQPMWDELGEFAGKDVRPRYENMRKFRLIGLESDMTRKDSHSNFNFVRALRIGTKIDVVERDDGTEMKGRMIAIINAHPKYSEIKTSDTQAIHEAAFERVDLAEVSEFRKVVRWLIEGQTEKDTALAQHESVYGANRAILNEMDARRDAKNRETVN